MSYGTYACTLIFPESAYNEELKELVGPEADYDNGIGFYDGVVTLGHSDCSEPGFEAIEAYLIQHKVAFDAYNEFLDGAEGSSYRYYRPQREVCPKIDIQIPCERGGDIMISVEKLNDLLSTTLSAEDIVANIQRAIDAANPFVPRLELYTN